MGESMRSEAERLRTFQHWPTSRIGVSPLALAGAGFYYVGQDDRVKCFSCRGTVMSWDNGDIPMQEHKKHFPQCEFLRNPVTAGNILYGMDGCDAHDSGYGSTQSDSAQVAQGAAPSSDHTSNSSCQQYNQHRTHTASIQYMRYEENRLQTLQTWPKRNVISIPSVAKAGLYFTGHDDKLQCAYCNGSMINWAKGDDPKSEHIRHFGDRCPLIKGLPTDNVPLNNPNGARPNTAGRNVADSASGSKSHTTNKLNDQLDRLNIVTERPKKAEMASFDKRLESFLTWPSGHNFSATQVMAEAGLYYTGVEDQVRCFFCNVGLKNWEAEDDPWEEHSKWSPKCGYLRQAPGETEQDQDNIDEKIDSPTSLKEENRRLKEERLCKECRKNPSDVVFLPCGHIVTCQQCAPKVTTCHKCKHSVEGTVKAFMA